jgi:hypothetical protein
MALNINWEYKNEYKKKIYLVLFAGYPGTDAPTPFKGYGAHKPGYEKPQTI